MSGSLSLHQAKKRIRTRAKQIAPRSMPSHECICLLFRLCPRLLKPSNPAAMQTAEVIGHGLGVEPTPEPGLREINNGAATGKTREEVKHLFIKPTRPLIDWVPYPGGENWMQLHRRVTATMDRIYKDIEENLIVVGHGGSLHHVIFWWLKLPTNVIEDINFGLDNACLTTLSISALDQRLLVRLNDTSHLRDLY